MLSSGGLLFASLLRLASVDPSSDPLAPVGCPVDKSRLVILPPGEQVTWREGLSASEYPLTQADIERAECLLIPQVDSWNAELAIGGGGEHIEAADYFRQYCVLRDREGHRIVFLNAFCSPAAARGTWQQTWVEVEDGGACYFQALFDLTAGRILEFSVNGEA